MNGKNKLIQSAMLEIIIFCRIFNENKLDCGALIGSMSDLLESMYVNVDSEIWAKASCLGSVGPKNQKLACSGSAVVHHKFKEAKKQVIRILTLS